MNIGGFPTSSDIYIEVDGRRLAVAQGYKVKAARENQYVEAFGCAEPVGGLFPLFGLQSGAFLPQSALVLSAWA